MKGRVNLIEIEESNYVYRVRAMVNSYGTLFRGMETGFGPLANEQWL